MSIETPTTFSIGELRHRISIQSPNAGRDAFGAEVVNWTEKLNVWASILPATSREVTTAAQIYPDATCVITIRYRGGLDPSMRIVYQGRNFDIVGFNDPGEKHFILQIACIERPTKRPT